MYPYPFIIIDIFAAVFGLYFLSEILVSIFYKPAIKAQLRPAPWAIYTTLGIIAYFICRILFT